MKYSVLALTATLLIFISCELPNTQEALLIESLDRLPSLLVNNSELFSLSNEEILVSEREISLKAIHLLSDYSFSIQTGNETICLDQQSSFTKYPIAGKLTYHLEAQGIEVTQLLIFSRSKPGITILSYVKNVEKSAKSIKFIFTANTDLKSTGWIDKQAIGNALDQISFDQLTGIFTAKDGAKDWYAVLGSSSDFNLIPTNPECVAELSEYEANVGFEVSIELAANEELVIPVFVAGSDQSEFTAMETLADLRTDLFSDWDENFAQIDSLHSTSKLTIPSKEIQQMWEWSKYNAGISPLSPENEELSEFNPVELLQLFDQLGSQYTTQMDRMAFISNLEWPRHVAPMHTLIQPFILELLGIHADFDNRVTFIRPNFPEEWREASIENLWMDDNKLKVDITSNENQMTVEVTQSQKKAGISIEVPEEFSKVKVLGKEVSTDTKDGYRRILMTGDHVRIEAKKD